jgi:hypothetical protein
MNADFNPVPFTFELNANGTSLDINSLMGAASGFGPASIAIEVAGAGTSSKDVKASGTVGLAKGSFPDAEVFRGVDQALGKKVIVGAPYQETEARFRLEKDVLRLDPFQFETERARLSLDGTITLDGSLDLALDVATTREGVQIEGVGGNVLDVLSDDQGWVPIPMHVSGTTDDPKVRPDGKSLMAQAGHGAKREVKEAAVGALKSHLPRKKQ